MVKVAKIPRVNEAEELFKFQCRATKLPAFQEQFRFAECLDNRRFASDVAFVEYRVLVECCGGIWRKGGGAHSRPAKILLDMERHQYAARLGYFVLPFSTDEVYSGHAVEWTRLTLVERGWNGVI